MSKSPQVSVVVPLYNKRTTVKRTVDSVLAQTFHDFDLVVVDDGSTDGGPEFVEAAYDDPRVRVHRQANAGPGAARNAGVKATGGKLLAFLDADDAWSPRLLETATAKLRAHPECAAFTAAFWLEPDGIDRWTELQPYGFREGPWRLTPDIPRQDLPHCLHAFHSCTAVYRREAVTTYGGFYPERCTFGEDVFLWLQIVLNHPIYRHMEPLGHYHTEDSELGIGARKGSLPIEPVLTRPGPVRAACPPELREVLELWLAGHAARAAFMQLGRGDTANAAWLLEAFPKIRAWRTEHIKLRLRLASPALWAFASTVGRLGRSRQPLT